MTPGALVGSGCREHLAEYFFTRSLNHARGRAGGCCSLKRATEHLSQGKPDHGRDPASGDGDTPETAHCANSNPDWSTDQSNSAGCDQTRQGVAMCELVGSFTSDFVPHF